jgi:hypothetical protein
VTENSGLFVQKLNDSFANPSGRAVTLNEQESTDVQSSEELPTETKVKI